MKYLLHLLIFFFSFSLQAKTLIPVYTYHSKPPLLIDQSTQSGLYYQIVNHLNQASTIHHFELIYLPRKRVDKFLEENKLNGILLGVNPVWFKDKNEERYFWTSRVFTDRDEVISLKSTALEYTNSSSLNDKVFGGVRGFYYHGINELVKNKQALRIDTVHEIDLFSMILNKRIDAAVVSRSTLNYMVNKNQWQGKFYISRNPHDIYDRRILVPKHLKAVFTEITPIIDQLQYNQNWQQTIMQYK